MKFCSTLRIIRATLVFAILFLGILLLKKLASSPRLNNKITSVSLDRHYWGKHSKNKHGTHEKVNAHRITSVSSDQHYWGKHSKNKHGIREKVNALIKEMESSSPGMMKVFTNVFPGKASGQVPFISESKSKGKDRNIPLVCVSEPSLINCYEQGTAGFASSLITTLDHLRLCHLNNGTMSIHWRNCFGVCKPNPMIDSFPYYFEPLCPGCENKAKVLLYLGTSVIDYHRIGLENLPIKSKKILSRLLSRRIFKPVLDFSFRPREGLSNMYPSTDIITSQLRYEINFIIKKYLKVNSDIASKVATLYSKFMKGFNMLGIHVRGTDHWMESADKELPPLDKWVDTAKTIFQDLNEPKRIFLATDNQETISKFTDYFGKKMVIYTDAIRAKGYTDEAVHVNKDNDPIKIGQQVLIDILLLAKSDCFLHGESNVATLASYFNPKMRSFSLEDMIRNQKTKQWASEKCKDWQGPFNTPYLRGAQQPKLVTKSFGRDVKGIKADSTKHQKNESMNQLTEEDHEDRIIDHYRDMNDRVQCWNRNKDASFRPNIKAGKFIRFLDFEKYLYVDK